MPPPDALTDLFQEVPDDWETVADYERFYVQGLKDGLKLAELRTKADALVPAISEVPRVLEKTGWQRQLPSRHWEDLKRNALDRACRKSLLNLPKAAMVILAADVTVSNTGAGINVYDHVTIVPATSYISGLTFEVFDEFLETLAKDQKNPIRYLKRNLTQVNDGVFYDMIRGKTVTAKLANDMLSMMLSVMPTFGGVVSDDFQARIRAIRDLRAQDRLAYGKKHERRYTKKISASSAELFWG